MPQQIKSYSTGQQDILFSLLFPGKNRIFVDVGARDGVFISNTYILEKEHDWNGICVEPHPELFKELIKKRQVPCLNIAIADVAEVGVNLEFAMWKEGPIGHSGLSEYYNDKHLGMLKDYEHEMIMVNCFPLKKILRDNNIKRVDVLDIDVEGAETSTIHSINFEECHFNLIATEGANPEIEKFLYSKGFRFLTRLKGVYVYLNNIQIPP